MKKQKIKNITPRIFKGTRDFLPSEMNVREEIIRRMVSVFRRYGFQPMETPSLEFFDILTGKYGEEEEKMVYTLSYKGGRELALRYDLTVPLCRVIAMNRHLPKPFKRYQIQPVWRADRPQLKQGRFREFYQCDVDTVGSDSLLVDVEIITLSYDILKELGFREFIIRINSRKILRGIIDFLGLDVSKETEVCRSIDKLDKIGRKGVEEELKSTGYPDGTIYKLLDILDKFDTPDNIFEALEKWSSSDSPHSSPSLKEGISEMRKILDGVTHIPDKFWTWDLHLARGLDYYTGPIFETVLPSAPHIGSLTGGGRYDNLIGLFTGEDVPACGTTIGMDRIFSAMEQLHILPTINTTTEVMVCLFDESHINQNLLRVRKLREAGINTEGYFKTDKLKKQFAYADKMGIPVVLVEGPDETAMGVVTLKLLATGEQIVVSEQEIISFIKNLYR